VERLLLNAISLRASRHGARAGMQILDTIHSDLKKTSSISHKYWLLVNSSFPCDFHYAQLPSFCDTLRGGCMVYRYMCRPRSVKKESVEESSSDIKTPDIINIE